MSARVAALLDVTVCDEAAKFVFSSSCFKEQVGCVFPDLATRSLHEDLLDTCDGPVTGSPNSRN